MCSGVGGSQHIRRDGYLSTGVQGQSLPLAVGIGLRCKRTGDGRIAAAFVGDGTWGEGAVYEALNMAALWQVPVLVVVEHNGIAQSTPTSAQMAGSIADRAAAFGIDFVEITGHHVPEIRERLTPWCAGSARNTARRSCSSPPTGWAPTARATTPATRRRWSGSGPATGTGS